MAQFTNREFTGSFSGTSVVSNTFDDGVYSVTIGGNFILLLSEDANGVITGQATVDGDFDSTPISGTYPTPTASNGPIFGTAPVTGTFSNLSFSLDTFANVTFTGAANSTDTLVTGTAILTFDDTTGQFSLPISAAATGLPPVISISSYTGSVDEGSDIASVTLSRFGNTAQSSSVTLVTEDGAAVSSGSFPDFIAQSIPVTFAAGQTSATIQLSGITLDDLLQESSENFGIRLINPVNASLGFSTGSISILDDDSSIVTVGTGGADNLNGGPGPDTLQGAAGDDVVVGGKGNDELRGGAGADTLAGGDGFDLLIGALGNDVLQGNDNGDVLQGGQGDDWVGGGKGHDVEAGGEGSDTLMGGLGHDTLDAGNGDDRLEGGAGNDFVTGGGDDDFGSGDDGEDQLFGNQGMDTLLGGGGNDRLFGGQDGDSLQGGAGNDEVLGALGDDVVAGDAGVDSLFGGLGNDYLAGGDGNDVLRGGVGADTLHGGGGSDTLDLTEDSVSGGADIVLYQATEENGAYVDMVQFVTVQHRDHVSGFVSGEDLIAFGGAAGVALDDMVADGSLTFATGAANIDTTHEAIFRSGLADADLTQPGLSTLLSGLLASGVMATTGADALIVAQGETQTAFYYYQDVNNGGTSQSNIGAAEVRLIGIVEGQLGMADFGVL